MPRRTCGALVNWMLAYATFSSKSPRFREFNDPQSCARDATCVMRDW